MRMVENEVFYHIQNLDQLELKYPWEIGSVIKIGESLNPYSYVLEHGMSDEPNRKKWFEISLGHFFKCTREAVFEEVRLSKFPQLPSRRNCLWVIEDNQESIDFWWNHFSSKLNTQNSGGLSLLKLSLTGNVFKTSQAHLGNNLMTVNEIRKQAHRYWEAKNIGIDHEILFYGTLKVLDRIK